MFHLSDHVVGVLGKLQDTTRRIVRKYFVVEVREESLRTPDEHQLPTMEQQKDTHRIQVEAPPQFVPEEKKSLLPWPETERSPSLKGATRIGRSLFVKGELASNEDLIIDGWIGGKIELKDHQLAIGPNGIVHADIQAKNVTVDGKVVGNISASGVVTIQSTGSLVGGISAARIVINEGAHFKGTVDIILPKAQSAKV